MSKRQDPSSNLCSVIFQNKEVPTPVFIALLIRLITFDMTPFLWVIIYLPALQDMKREAAGCYHT